MAWSAVVTHVAVRRRRHRIRTILVQLLNAVHYIHSKQIIHRDLKLDNILLMEPNTDRVKVADFGVCFRKTDARGSAETKVRCTPRYLPGCTTRLRFVVMHKQ
jgi:serine/threonine protein kinase